VSANGIHRVLKRQGLQSSALRNRLFASYAAPPEPERPGELVQLDCFCVRRLAGTKGVVWQCTTIDAASSRRQPRVASPVVAYEFPAA
jgi:hypothetical protein